MIIPTDGGLRPGHVKWEPMRQWLTANRFDVNQVPNDARIEIKDGTCLEVEVYTRDSNGRMVRAVPDDLDSPPARRVERHPMTTAPPDVLLPVVP